MGNEAWNSIIKPLVQQFGGVGRVPSDILDQHGLIRIGDANTRTWRILLVDEWKELLRRCKSLLWRRRGYIFAHDLKRLRKMSESLEVVFASELSKIDFRAQDYLDAGIPPIFSPLVYTPTVYLAHEWRRGGGGMTESRAGGLFPSVDFLIQFANGSYFRRLRAQAAKSYSEGIKRDKYLVQPTTVQDVREYRQLAFTSSGTLEQPLIRESLDYIAEHFQFSTGERRDQVVEQASMALAFLEDALRDFSVPPLAPKVWDGNPGVVANRCWYLGYSLADREAAIRAWIASFSKRPTAKDRKVFERLQRQFPDWCHEAEKIWKLHAADTRAQELTAAFERAETAGDFRELPAVLLIEDPWKDRVLPVIAQHFQRRCAEVLRTDPEALFENAGTIHALMLVPAALPLVPRFKSVLDDFRHQAAMQLSNERFLGLFGNPFGGARTALGHTRYREETWKSKLLIAYLNARYQELTASADSLF